VKIKQLVMGAVIGTSAVVFMLHRLPRKSEAVENPVSVKPQIKTHKIASARKVSRHPKSSAEPQLSSRKLFG